MAQDTFFTKRHSINCRGNLLFLDEPIVMGILNVTPDSFFDGGRHNSIDNAIEQAKKMLNEGASIIDIGGYSSRPGAENISEEVELNRVIPIIEKLVEIFPDIIISIDTFRSEIAIKAIEAGASLINDISGGEADANMFETVAKLQVPYILMHMQGTPQTMQEAPSYNDVTADILKYLSKKVNELKALNVNDIILDPGFGFGKTIDQNYQLLDQLNQFQILGSPILVGLSRKSMIWKKLNISPEEALPETCRLNGIALQKGASILRVHDVKEAKEVISNSKS